jgi:DNA polymerase-3 subunit delta
MTALKAHEVARFLMRPNMDEGIFLAYGPDAGLVRETGQKLLAFFGKDDPEIEIVSFDAAELDAEPDRLAIEAKTVSLFGNKRLIRVRNAGKSLVQALTGLADDPGGAIIILEAGNLLPRDPLRAMVEGAANARALPCYPDNGESLGTLIRDTFSKNGIAVEPEVIPFLRDSLGNDREVTRTELEKLVLFAAASKKVTLADAVALCADNAALVIDEIADATGTGHAERLDTALNRALGNAVDPQRLLTTSLMHFSGLRRWRAEVDAGRPARTVLDGARPRPHFSRRHALEQQLRLWSDPVLAQATTRLQLAIAESRRRPALAETLLRRTLTAICMLAAER